MKMNPVKTSLPQIAHVVGITQENATVRTLELDLSLDAAPGQFVMAWLPGMDEKPFSLVQSRPVTLTVCCVGPFSSAIHELEPGDPLWVRGPLGTPFQLPEHRPPGGSLLMLGGGYGVAPLYFLAQRAIEDGWIVHMIIGARCASDIVFEQRFAQIGAQVTITTDDGSMGQAGLVTDAAVATMAQTHYEILYACGPEPMLQAVRDLARQHQRPAQLSYERYMRCGFGVCGSCAREGWLVCKDGPVMFVDPNEE